jgi:DNA-binding MarR family transcriptional regulator
LANGRLHQNGIIDMNIHEKTTGMEVIKRLLNNGLIEQTDDPKDRRSKRLLITGKGMGVLFGTFEEMRKASLIIAERSMKRKKCSCYTYFKNCIFFISRCF